MLRYSSRQFEEDWRYAVEQDFATETGEPFPYAPGGHQSWGDEAAMLPLPDVSECCVSGDGSRLAAAVDETVYVFDMKTQATVAVLKGHLTRVSGVAFQPNNANVLVTSSHEVTNFKSGNAVIEQDAVTVVWKLDEIQENTTQDSETTAAVARASASAAAEKLSAAGMVLSRDNIQELERLIAPAIEHVVTKNRASGKIRVHGILHGSFGSNIFSPSGRFMVYVPGNSPVSNDVGKWDICICQTDDFTSTRLTLSGHTDGIMWMGWNNDESLFASVSWDSTVRLWNANSGEIIRVLKTDDQAQNWTGEFSPDSKLFVATSGRGRVHIYDLQRAIDASATEEDVKYWVYPPEPKREGWRRAISWHPNSRWLAVGKETGDELLLLDIGEKKVLQIRRLSAAASQVDKEELRGPLSRMSSVVQVQFVGDKLVVLTSRDGSPEVYDLAKEQKWRFGRGGTEELPGFEKWRDENGKVTSRTGCSMVVWEDDSNLRVASVDGDGIRFWNIPLEKQHSICHELL